MATYLITGVSRGIGFEFLRQLSSDSANKVIGLVRNKESTDKKIAAELGQRDNVYIFQADMTDYNSLKASVDEVARITGGSLDFIIANAALMSTWSVWPAIGDLGNEPEVLEKDILDMFRTNVVGNIHLFNLFMPLVLKGKVKKVLAISSGLADIESTAKYDLDGNAPYAISKAAMNAAVAKFSAQYKKDGVLFLSVCPGVVNTGQYDNMTPEEQGYAGALMAKFQAYAPDFAGPVSTEFAVKDVLSVLDKASITSGDAGAYVSHYGNKQWL
ncbi:hypothetical protein BP6252_07575 [Coleophoma cylindrospora]|uniref:Uncharacterized protein n=1 Tax=Coleophoma cylindrospora TaxID=1849047 RepID=A0A3D8RAD6_9HELO|nr:hypothetical protein BP6252_07575 [Coleophoma cylindrospora]